MELLGLEFLSRLLFCFFISLFLLSELFLESPLLSVLKELERFVLKMNKSSRNVNVCLSACLSKMLRDFTKSGSVNKSELSELLNILLSVCHLAVDAVCDAEGGWSILTGGALEGT